MLDGGVFPIQGPPGTGKSYTGARMICRLVQQGKKVGITANSHKVIRHLIDKVLEAAKETGIELQCIQKPKEMEPDQGRLVFAKDNADVFAALGTGECQVAGAQSARTVILLGDPQQLDQPTQGTHPDGVGVSSLEHVLGAHHTIRPDCGLFLEQTWRLHPDICAFNSELFYYGKLLSREGCERRAIRSGGPVTGFGLRYLPVPHTGNQSSSIEEADAVAR